MATLAYAVAQSTTNMLMPVKVKPGGGNLKPNGKSYITASFIQAKTVIDKNKPSGYSAASPLNPTKSIAIIKSNITFGFQSIGNLVSTKKVVPTKWYQDNISFSKSSSTNMVATSKVTSWTPSTFGTTTNSSLVAMKTGNLQYGTLITPYVYGTLALGNLMTSKVSLVNSQFSSPVETMYNQKMLTLKTGVISAYGDVSRNAGWIN